MTDFSNLYSFLSVLSNVSFSLNCFKDLTFSLTNFPPFSINNSNASHVVATDKFGNVGTGTSAVAVGSGTTIEVFAGGEVLDFVGNLGAGATGKATAGPLAENEWYIKSVDAAGGDITLGSISETNDVVTVSDHSIHNSTNNFPSEDTEVIKYEIEAKVGDRIVTGETFQTIAKSKAGADGAVIVELYYRNNDSTGPGIAAPTGATFNFETKGLLVLPNTTLLAIQSMYAAQRTTPVLAKIATK